MAESRRVGSVKIAEAGVQDSRPISGSENYPIDFMNRVHFTAAHLLSHIEVRDLLEQDIWFLRVLAQGS